MILIIGESGTGKSTSLEELNHEETFIIQSISKPLPFKGWRKKYRAFVHNKDQSKIFGNLFVSDNAIKIVSLLTIIEKEMPHIKNVIIDDFQYIMSNEFMRRVKEKGFDKFNDIGQNAWMIINKLNSMREDLICIVMSHSDVNDQGKTKLKTLGKMLDDKVCIEGMFTVVLESTIFDGQYLFVTQNNGSNTCKSPKDMFNGMTIPNNLKDILEAYNKYNEEDIEDLIVEMTEAIVDCNSQDELLSIWASYSILHKNTDIIDSMKLRKTEIELQTNEDK